MRSILFIFVLLGFGGCLDTEASFARQLFKAIQEQNVDRLESFMLPADAQIKIQSWPDNNESRKWVKEYRKEVATVLRKQSEERLLNDAEYLGYSLTGDGISRNLYLKYQTASNIDSIMVRIFKREHQHYLMIPDE